MSYTKLFGSILDSTIWQAPDHVRLVWITMLAMKDRDGFVEASIPGLAYRARKSLAETEDALAVLMAPDLYSRTKDHEGRRIETIAAGGWRILNHDIYRDREDQDERREKTAIRVARHRERKRLAEQSGHASVTLGNAGNAPSRDLTPSDADTYTDPDRRAPVEISSSPARAIPPVPAPAEECPPAPGLGPSKLSDPEPAPTPPLALSKRQKLNHDVWSEARLAHELARSQGLDPGSRAWTVMPSGQGGSELAARTAELLEHGDEAYARATYRHVIDLRIAEAKNGADRSLKYVIPSRLFARDSFWKAVELSIDQVTQVTSRPARGADPPGQIRIVRDELPPPGLEDLP